MEIWAVLLGSMMSLGSLDNRETSATQNRSWIPRTDEHVLTLVGSARGEVLSEHRRRNPVANCEPSDAILLASERLDVPARGLLSRVNCVASRGRTVFSPAEVSLKREAALPMRSQSASQSARVFNVDGSSQVFVERVGCMSGRANFVTEQGVFLESMGVHFRGGVPRIRISPVADDEIGFCRWRCVRACGVFFRCEVGSDVRGH